MKRRLIALLISVCLFVGTSTVTAFADDNTVISDKARIGYYNDSTQSFSYVLYKNQIDNNIQIQYNASNNTLTLNNYKGESDVLFIGNVGKNFKLCINGDCELGTIRVSDDENLYGTQLNISGTGKLTINKSRSFPYAIQMTATGSQTCMNVSKSVSLDLYADDSCSLILVYGTTYKNVKEAICADNKPIIGATGDQVTYMDSEYVPVAIVEDPDIDFTYGFKVSCKTDTTGIYDVEVDEENNVYSVGKYIFVEELNTYVIDPEWGDRDNHRVDLTKAEFESQYEFTTIPQDEEIYFTDSDIEENLRGYTGFKAVNSEDISGEYVAYENWDEDDNVTYTIYRVYWNKSEQIYSVDDLVDPEVLSVAELKNSPFTIDEGVIRRFVTPNYDISDYGVFAYRGVKKSDPGTVYAMVPTWYAGSDYDTYDEIDVVKLKYNNKRGYYFADGNVGHYTASDFRKTDYSIVKTEQPYYLSLKGYPIIDNYLKYTDNNDNIYAVSYMEEIYNVSNDRTVSYGGQSYYTALPNYEVQLSDLNNTFHEVKENYYEYSLSGQEYHFVGSGIEVPEYLIGDVNGDGKVDVTDATQIQKYAAGLIVFNATQLKAGDLNGDGKVDVTDATRVQRIAAGLF